MRDSQVTEGSAAHFEAKLVPVGDPRLRVEWLKDGRPIQASNRMSTLHDFGFVALDLKYTRPDDTGVYTCRAVNQLGEAVINANLQASHLSINHLDPLTDPVNLYWGKKPKPYNLNDEA